MKSVALPTFSELGRSHQRTGVPAASKSAAATSRRNVHANAGQTRQALPDHVIGKCEDTIDWNQPAAHPRLFAVAHQFATLQLQIASDPTTAGLAAVVMRQADDAQAEPAIIYAPGPGGILLAVRAALGRVLASAMAYRLWNKSCYLDRARQELLALVAMPDWHPAHFLDVGEACLAAAVGLDWLYDILPPDDRQAISQAIIDKALRVSLDVPAGGNSWLNGDFNWNPVCHAGLTAGAIAVMDVEPDLSRQVIERAIRYVPSAAATYAPDGAYPEGPSYWSYGTNFYILFIESLRSAFGTSLDFELAPGFLASADWVNQTAAPSGEDFNFSDYHPRHGIEPAMLWFARELGRDDLARSEVDAITKASDALAAGGGIRKEFSGPSRLLPLALLFWDPVLARDSGTAPTMPLTWVAGGQLPIATLRSGWNDPRATYVAIKGGTPNGSHGHMDVGSFILEADGVRWAVDLGTESYDRMRSAGIDLWNYTQGSSRWSTFRCGPEGHNIIRFDNGHQIFDGFATIDRVAGARGAVVDLTPMYQGKASAVSRRVTLSADRSVTFSDTWTAGPAAADVSWQWLTKAAVTLTPTGAVLSQSGRTLNLEIKGPPGTKMIVEDVSAPRAPQDSSNPGLTRIVVKCHTAAEGMAGLTVRAMPGAIFP